MKSRPESTSHVKAAAENGCCAARVSIPELAQSLAEQLSLLQNFELRREQIPGETMMLTSILQGSCKKMFLTKLGA